MHLYYICELNLITTCKLVWFCNNFTRVVSYTICTLRHSVSANSFLHLIVEFIKDNTVYVVIYGCCYLQH